MKYFSLFTGIGGFELGIQQAYELQEVGTEPKDSANASGGTPQHAERPLCVGYSEIDKYAVQIYQSHFPEHKPYGDITKINADTLPDFDLLCGGFPCQAFSVAGKRRGFDDTRGTLFFDICRLAKAKRPRLLLLENVKGLLNHDRGQTFRVILASLDELGYDCQWQVCNSKDFGVPQNRERVIIVGHLRGTPRPQVFPIYGTDSTNSDVSIIGHRKNYRRNSQVFDPNGITEALDTGQGGGRGQYTVETSHTVRSSGRASGIDKKQNWDTYQFGSQIRRLTPTECERLQGFPDGWTAGVSDTQRYKTLGNAVTVNVIQAVANKLITHSLN